MTFVEAAIEVLKREGKPLPVKRLAELAVKHNLLSVVGRDPEGTMQLRLADAVEGRGSELLEIRPGVYGLRSYPAAPPPVETPAAPEAEAAEAKPEEGEKKGRRRGRRGGRGKGKGKTETVEAKPAQAKPAKPVEKGEKGEKGEKKGRRRRRRRGDKEEAATTPTVAEGEATAEAQEESAENAAAERAEAAQEATAEEAFAAGIPEPEMEVVEPAAEAPGEELLDHDEIDLPGGPLLAPTHGAEDLTRGDEERVVRAEIPGRREERGRHRRDRRDRHQLPQQQPQQQPQQLQQQPQQQPAAPQPQAPSRRSVLDGVLELLRQSDGRPMHVRHLTDLGIKKQLLSGQPNEVLRQVRAALVREVREREAEGLRARVRSLGGGNYALVDRKLDQDLAQAERELADKAARQREATRMALRRRLGRLPPPAFEALARVLLDKLGVTNVEMVRRGEGVVYFGGVRQLGAGVLKTLVAVRAGEAELGRRAVGELRAGLQARGYDEGLLLGAGRLGQDGAAELKSGSGVVLHDGLSLATLLIKHGLGVRRLHLPVDYLDLEFLGELSEG
jgi:hypothetical protein